METNKYNIENFERFLREKTDEFRMYPSKRVWYSIYNNMHPGNRFPSVSMSIVLIGFLFLVGYLNTDINESVPGNSVNKEKLGYPVVGAQNNLLAANTPSALSTSKNISFANPQSRHGEKNTTAKLAFNRHGVIKSVQNFNVTVLGAFAETVNNQNADNSEPGNILAVENKMQLNFLPHNEQTIAIGNSEEKNDIAVNYAMPSTKIQSLPVNVPGFNSENGFIAIAKGDKINNEKNTGTAKSSVPTKVNAGSSLSLADKGWIEDYALHNRPVKKYRGKTSVLFYVTPSIVYRSLTNNAEGKKSNGSNNLNNYDPKSAVIHKPSFGAETGVSLQLAFTKRIKLKAGLQFNYTRYNAHAYSTNHPIATSLNMNAADGVSTYEVFKTTEYSNSFGLYPVKLHNETYQLSVPVGADIKLASLDNVSLYAGATIQPTFVAYAKSYLLSADRRSYIQDPSLLNRFNLNAGFETYISYKTCGYTWQLGPQYRTQVFSTNSKMYAVEERLVNFGFKIGVAKQL